MNVFVNVQQVEGEEPLTVATEEIATQVLELFGGDAERDTCTVSISPAPSTATVGGAPPGPTLPEEVTTE